MSTYWTFTPNPSAASSVSLNDWALPGWIEVPNTATRESRGTTSFRSSSRFPLSSGDRVDSPVIFPPGRARLATNPEPTGSLSNPMITGMVVVAFLAALVSAGPPVTISSTLRRTRSAARSGSRSKFPSAHRYSMTMFFPSTYPSSRRPRWSASMRAEILEGEVTPRNPIIRGTFAGCCASPKTATASNAPATRIDANAVFLNGRLIAGVIYHADGNKEKRYLQAKATTFGRGSRKNFAFRIELRRFSVFSGAWKENSVQS